MDNTGSDNDKQKYIFDKKIEHLVELGYQAESYAIDNHIGSGGNERFRTEISFRIVIFMIHYVDSLVILMKRKNLYASENILRTIFEAWANLHYIYATSSYENLVRYLYSGDQAFINNAKATRDIFRDTPNETNEFTELYDEMIKERQKVAKSWGKYGHPLKRMQPLKDRIKILEKKFNSVDFTLYYHHEYYEFSDSVHVTKRNMIAMSYAEDYNEYFSGFENDYVKAIRMINTASDILSKSVKLLIKKTGKSPTEEQAIAINKPITWRVEE